ncbi:hypothetical protein [Nocardia australiensis]|uniref:hypothetical protein n=1 Tax=Nocardia australiensis TaxID=2887191 RepID=UPI001D15DC5F|nr:hypothetical protein [Nocardia australiensis]
MESRLRTVEPLELEIAQEIPDVCSRHGRPAVSKMRFRTTFYNTLDHPRHPGKPTSSRFDDRAAPASTLLVGDWPICDQCERSNRWCRRIAAILAYVMGAILINFVVVCAAGWAEITPEWARNIGEIVVIPLALAVFPGTIPIGLLVAMLFFRKTTQPVTFRPIDDEKFVFVQAHPGFRDAMRAIPGG